MPDTPSDKNSSEPEQLNDLEESPGVYDDNGVRPTTPYGLKNKDKAPDRQDLNKAEQPGPESESGGQNSSADGGRSLYSPSGSQALSARQRIGGWATQSKVRRNLIFGSVGGSLLLIPLFIFLAILFPSLKIPQLASEIEGYRLARLSRAFYTQASILQEDSAAIQNSTDVAVKDLVGKTPLGKSMSLYKPTRVISNMKANDVLSFEYDKNGKLSKMVYNLRDGTKAAVDVPEFKFSANPKTLLENYKERIRFATETKAAINQALDGSNFLVRSRVAKTIQSANGVHLLLWEKAANAFSGKNAKAADELNAKLLEERTKAAPVTSKSAKINKWAEDAQRAEEQALSTPAGIDDALANDGIPTGVKKVISSIKVNTNSAMNYFSPIYALAFPVCIAYDTSSDVATQFLNSQSAAATQAFFTVAVGASQQEANVTTPEAVGALGRAAGNIDTSIPGQIANGKTVDTSNEISPQAARSGEFTMFNALDTLIHSQPGDTTKVLNWFFDNLCPALTNTDVGIALGLLSLWQTLDPPSWEIEGVLSNGVRAVATKIGTSILSQIKTRITYNAVKNVAFDTAGQEAATTGMTYLARMLVLSQIGTFTNMLDKKDFANLADMGATVYGNAMSQQETFGRPLTTAEANSTEQQDLGYLNEQNANQSTYTRNFALSNPYSPAGKLAMAAGNVNMASITGLFTNLPHLFANIFSPFGHLLGAHAFAATPLSAQDYGVVQFGWSPDEENLIQNDPSYDPVVNAKIIADNKDAVNKIAQDYAACFGYSADGSGNLTQASSPTIGDLLGGSDPKIQRDNDGNVIANKGTCSPSNLSYNSHDSLAADPSTPDHPQDLIFRWRLYESNLNVMNELQGAQNPVASSDTGSPADGGAVGSVYFVGDSLSVGMSSLGDLAQKVTNAGGSVSKVEATKGDPLDAALPKVQADTSEIASASTVVVELGTNNGATTSASSFTPKIKSMISAIKAANPNAKIYWMNVYKDGDSSAFSGIDQAIADQASIQGYTVIDWHSEAQQHNSSYAPFDSALHVHPAHYDALATFVVNSIFGAGAQAASPSKDAQQYAQQILKVAQNGTIHFAVVSAANEKDNSTAEDNVKDVAKGQPAHTSTNCGSSNQPPSATTPLNATLLQFILDLSNSTDFTINELAGGCHTNSDSSHYKGTAVDFGCPFDAAAADKIGAQYGISDGTGETCADKQQPHYHYSIGGN